MNKEDYIKTVEIDGIKVDIGMDDYGQCYYFEYTDKDGEFHQYSCGTYNMDYMFDILYTVSPRFHELFWKDELTNEEREEYAKYEKLLKEE